jgi:hypothetical protein
LPHPPLDFFGAEAKVCVTRVEIAPRVEDGDDGLPDILLVGEAHLLGAGAVPERPQIVDAKPSVRSEGFGRAAMRHLSSYLIFE